MNRFDSPFGTVELTDERFSHIIKFHPEIKRFKKRFPKILSAPKLIRSSKSDKNVFILYGLVDKQRNLAIVVKTGTRNFILTAYLTSK